MPSTAGKCFEEAGIQWDGSCCMLAKLKEGSKKNVPLLPSFPSATYCMWVQQDRKLDVGETLELSTHLSRISRKG
jgi:hypothetical protein